MVKDDRRFHGVPLRFAYTPHPVVGMPPTVLRGYIEGKDPATNRTVIEELLDALTRPVAQDERAESFAPISRTGTRQALLEPDTEDNLQRLFYERGWTDGLPVILPTEERVARMLTGTSHAPDEIVGEVFLFDTKERLKFTVEMVAIVAVMAGARPEHLPVLLAVASTTQPAVQPSTTPFACMLMVNGPIRNELGMNSGIGAFAPGNLANSVIGRAWTLLTINWGHMRLKKTLWSSQGNPVGYNNMCVAENEERSPWEPFHVQKGLRADESAISIFRGWSFINNGGGASHRSVGREIMIQLQALPALYSTATLILDPIVARHLKRDEGFEKKQDFARWLAENYKIPAGQFWDTDLIDMLMGPMAENVEPYATWKKLPKDVLIAPYNKPENINIVVVGGKTSPLWKTSDFAHTTTVPVDKWRARPVDDCADGSCGLPDPEPANQS
ncbi:MAG TPA: UGSC family (seleno)protein [Candidatus Dormibacteraeota bacterium]|nr:UGSC family (seleno)protein [Candidatus Dormibacteraeota bacterium]